MSQITDYFSKKGKFGSLLITVEYGQLILLASSGRHKTQTCLSGLKFVFLLIQFLNKWFIFSVETRTRDEDGERENADRLSVLEGITHFLDDLKFPSPMITQFEIQYSAFEVIFMESNCLFL